MNGFSSPIARARNHGSVGNGSQAFLWERLSALALIPVGLGLFLQLFALSAGGVDLAEARAWLGDPFSGGLTVLFFNLAMLNAYLCSRVMIEDYMHVAAVKFTALVAMVALLIILDLVVTMSVLTVMFGV